MANPPCNSGDGREAVFIGTMLATGDTIAVCDECLVAFSAALLSDMTGVDPRPFLEAISDDAPTPEPAATGGGDPPAAEPPPIAAAPAETVEAPPRAEVAPDGEAADSSSASGSSPGKNAATPET